MDVFVRFVLIPTLLVWSVVRLRYEVPKLFRETRDTRMNWQ